MVKILNTYDQVKKTKVKLNASIYVCLYYWKKYLLNIFNIHSMNTGVGYDPSFKSTRNIKDKKAVFEIYVKVPMCEVF